MPEVKYFFLICLFSSLFLNSDGIAEEPEKLSFFHETWNTEDGLAHNTITDIQQSSDGYLWFSTWEGLSRFNGEKFTSSTELHGANFSDSGAWVMERDPLGNIYIGGAEGQIVSRSPDRSWLEIGNAKSQINEIVYHPNHNLLVAAENGNIYQVNEQKKFSIFLPATAFEEKSVLSITYNEDLLFLGTESGLKMFSDGELLTDNRFENYRINDLLIQSDRLVLGTDRGIFSISLNNPKEATIEISNVPATTLLVDKNNRLWIGSYRHGLLVFDGLTLVNQYFLNTGLLDNRVLSIFEDKEDNIWVGTNGGLTRFRETFFNSYGKQQGLDSEFARAVLKTEAGEVWAGTSGGLFKLSGTSKFKKVLEKKSILSLAHSQERGLFVGTYASGVYVVKDGEILEFSPRSKELPSREIRSIAIGQNDELAIGTSNGLILIDGDAEFVFDESSGMQSDFVAVAKFIDDRLWLGTSQGFYSISNGEISEVLFDPKIGAVQVFDFVKEPNSQNLWIATSKGLTRLNQNSAKFDTLSDFGDVPTQKVLSVNIDLMNNFWLSTNHGVIRLPLDSVKEALSDNLLQAEVDWFTENDGMLSRQSNGRSTPSTWFDKVSNELWVATAKGVTTAILDKFSNYKSRLPDVTIESITVGIEERDITQKITLVPQENTLRVDFASLDFVFGEQIYYRVKPSGVISEWTYRGQLNFIEYFNLAPGEYIFEVQASYDNQNWSGSTSLILVKEPFWWQTIFAKVALYTTIGIVILMIFWIRASHAKRTQARLEALVSQRTRELEEQSKKLTNMNDEKSLLLKDLNEKSLTLEKLSNEDALTGLLNRRAFEKSCDIELHRLQRNDSQFCICFFDIDHFKKINDKWSHQIGDKALIAISNIIQTEIRDVDHAVRWGGEEFILLLTDSTLPAAMKCCERIREAIESFDCSGFAEGLSITISCGIALAGTKESIDNIIHNADTALYEAKQSGRNRTIIYQ
jgi:diguanylate cyclase (GGDEF)-like protein